MGMDHNTQGAKPLPSVEFLEECIDYDPDTGVLAWRERPVSHFEDGTYSAEVMCKRWNSRFAGKEAGSVGSEGYRYVSVDGQPYLAHRLAFKMYYGRDPIPTVNHKAEGLESRRDNRIANLEEACMIGQANDKRTNNDLPRGVALSPTPDKYGVRVCNTYLGEYDTVEEAAEVAKYGYEYLAFMRNSGYSLLKNETGLPSNNTSGYTGVYSTKNGKWLAQGNRDGKSIYLGTFKCKHEAAMAVKQWREGRNRHASQTSCNAL